jgi:hypothetical protein
MTEIKPNDAPPLPPGLPGGGPPVNAVKPVDNPIENGGTPTWVKNWKSTAQGVLSGMVALGAYFTALPTGSIPQHTAGYITVSAGAAKVLLGFFEKDAK